MTEHPCEQLLDDLGPVLDAGPTPGRDRHWLGRSRRRLRGQPARPTDTELHGMTVVRGDRTAVIYEPEETP